MKKNLFLILLVFVFSKSFSQNKEIKKTISDFFVAFHAKDTVSLKAISHKWIVMQTIGKDKEGVAMVVIERYDDFIKSISAIPNEMKFEEKLLDFQIQSDGTLAHVWTPYEFYVNNKLSHKGVNSFTLVKEADKWKIVHVIDTRHKG